MSGTDPPSGPQPGVGAWVPDPGGRHQLRWWDGRDYTAVVADQGIREGIKAFSNWPTIPQIYVKGEFVGGCDITREMFQSGELQTFLAEKGVPVKTAAA